MSSEVAIRTSGLGKTFRIYSRPHHRLAHALFPHQGGWSRDFRALSGINLEILQGETVGVVGRNGSGKSTLLQLICGTLNPTEGSLTVNGRIAALLELGAGFNPEFSGRENVFLNGTVIGLSRKEVQDRFQAITAFADIGEYIDQPVKTYSSGMYVRLAFAVAINTDPKILVVDEALSVGDEAFQRKCFARIEELKRGGCTILFVSHSAGSIVQLCDRALLLDGGELVYTGDPKSTVALYQRLLYAAPERRAALRQELQDKPGLAAEEAASHDGSSSRKQATISATDLRHAERFDPGLRPESTVEYESRGARIIDPHLVTEAGERVNVIVPAAVYLYRFQVEFSREARNVHFGMMLKSPLGVELFGMSSHAQGDGLEKVDVGSLYDVEFRFLSRLLPGTYFMNAGVVGAAGELEDGFLHRVLDVFMFKVEQLTTDRRKAGFYDLSSEPACSFARIEPAG